MPPDLQPGYNIGDSSTHTYVTGLVEQKSVLQQDTRIEQGSSPYQQSRAVLVASTTPF